MSRAIYVTLQGSPVHLFKDKDNHKDVVAKRARRGAAIPDHVELPDHLAASAESKGSEKLGDAVDVGLASAQASLRKKAEQDSCLVDGITFAQLHKIKCVAYRIDHFNKIVLRTILG